MCVSRVAAALCAMASLLACGPGDPGGAKLRANGMTCSGDEQCASGACAQGVCCEGACTGTCRSCAVPGREGTCSQSPTGSSCDDGNGCTGGDACNAAGACSGCQCGMYCAYATWDEHYGVGGCTFVCDVTGPGVCGESEVACW